MSGSKADENGFAEDYTTWSNADLIQRVTRLESELREQNEKHARLSSSSRASSQPAAKRPRKAPKPFDPSKYSTRHIALKFAYLGARYNGFEHHANNKTPLPTVEEVLWRALRKTKLILPTFGEKSEDEVCWDGCEYSKCGRTDKGVSAFGQVIGLRVRSSRPKDAKNLEGEHDADGQALNGDSPMPDISASSQNEAQDSRQAWHHIRDELPYLQLLNRVLPPNIRMLAWAPEPPPNFSARFDCKERRYRYFFTNPAYLPNPTDPLEGSLDIKQMQKAAEKLVGLHDFRNFCKIDPSKQLTDFRRRIFSAGISELRPGEQMGDYLLRPPYFANGSGSDANVDESEPKNYYFEVRGSAFLWHQVRHMMAILFLVGEEHEDPDVVDELLDIEMTPAKPVYDMASDIPLVLWDCIFPDTKDIASQDHAISDATGTQGYEDALDWIYIGDQERVESSNRVRAVSASMQDRKHGRQGIMEDLWSLWRKRKIDELLAGSLMNVVSQQGRPTADLDQVASKSYREDASARIFDGSDCPRNVGSYVSIMNRQCVDTPAALNARYALRKGLNESEATSRSDNIDD